MWLAGSGLLGGGPTGEGVGKSVALAVARHDSRIALSLRLLWHGLVETAEGAWRTSELGTEASPHTRL